VTFEQEWCLGGASRRRSSRRFVAKSRLKESLAFGSSSVRGRKWPTVEILKEYGIGSLGLRSPREPQRNCANSGPGARSHPLTMIGQADHLCFYWEPKQAVLHDFKGLHAPCHHVNLKMQTSHDVNLCKLIGPPLAQFFDAIRRSLNISLNT
jgi:hypothetical protein